MISCKEEGVELNDPSLVHITGYEKVIKDLETGLQKKIKYTFKTADINTTKLCDSKGFIGEKVYKEEWLQDDPIDHPDVYKRVLDPKLIGLKEALNQVCNDNYDIITIVDVDMFSKHERWKNEYAAFF